MKLHKAFDISTIEESEAAVSADRLKAIKGLGPALGEFFCLRPSVYGTPSYGSSLSTERGGDNG
jgi:hypothetical protein